MTRRRRNRKKNRKGFGITPLVEPGYGAIYVRTPWIMKLKQLGKKKPRQVRKLHQKQK
ncbi:MAG: hypothetical protein ACFFDJ_10205 [Candidatus Odinarchaeota archaeon]